MTGESPENFTLRSQKVVLKILAKIGDFDLKYLKFGQKVVMSL